MASDGKVSIELTAETASFVQAIKAASEQFRAAFGIMEKAAQESASAVDKAFGTLKIRGLSDIKKDAAGVRAAFDTIVASVGRTSAEGQRAFQAMQQRLKELDAEAKNAGKAVAGVGSGVGFSSLAGSVASAVGAFLTLRTAVHGVQAVVSAGMGLERLEGQLRFATGSSAAAAESLEFLRKTARTLGLDFTATATSFAKFAAATKGTKIEGEQTRAVFTSVAKAASVMKLSAEETEGVFLALSQMISKGKVQAEELRGQLGERLPGAFQIAARAMGVTTSALDDMLKKGEVMADDFLPKFADEMERTFGKDAQTSANNFQGAMNNLSQTWQEFLQEIAKSGVMQFATEQLRAWAAEFNRMKQSGELSKIARGVADAIVAIGRAIAGTIEFVARWGKEIAIVAASLAGLTIIGRIQAALTVFAAGLPLMTAAITALRTALTGLLATAGTAVTALVALKAAFLILPAAIYVGYNVLGGMVERLLIAIGVLDKTEEQLNRETEALKKTVETHQQFNAVIQKLDASKLDTAAEAVRKLKQAALDNPAMKDELFAQAEQFASKISGLQKRLDSERQTLADLEKQRQDVLRGVVVQTEQKKIDAQIEQTKRLLDERRRAIDEAIRLEQQYAEAAIRWHERATQARSSTSDQIRELQRKGLSEEAQQADIAAQAQEKLGAAAARAEQARQAASQGNAQAAEKAAQETERLAQQAENLAGRLKDTGSAIQVVQQAGSLIEQSANAAAAANERAAASAQASIERQKADLASLTQQLADLEKKKLLVEIDVKIDAARKTIADLETQINDAFSGLQEFAKSKGISIDIKANDQQARTAVSDLQKPTDSQHTIKPEATAAQQTISELQQPTSSVHTIYIQKVESNAAGGPISSAARRARGNVRGAGTGTSDSILSWLSNGEFVMRASAVRKWGVDFLTAMNYGFMPALPIPQYAAGGPVGKAVSAGVGGGEEMTIKLEIGGSSIPVRTSRDKAMELAGALRELSRGK